MHPAKHVHDDDLKWYCLDYDELVTASFFKCSINTWRLTSSVRTWPPPSWNILTNH